MENFPRRYVIIMPFSNLFNFTCIYIMNFYTKFIFALCTLKKKFYLIQTIAYFYY